MLRLFPLSLLVILILSLAVGLSSRPDSASAAFPSDSSGRIAFMSTRGDPDPAGCDPCNFDIFWMDPDFYSGDVSRITTDPAFDSSPAWSPDGYQLMFVRSQNDLLGDIVIRDMDPAHGGTVYRALGQDGDASPAWSPDGTRIAFTSDREGDMEIYSMNAADGSDVTRLTNMPGADYGAAWSPDGTRIAFYNGVPCCDIYVMDADGGNVTNLTSSSSQDRDPNWSPDGSQLAFFSSRDDSLGEIYVMNADGSGVTRLTNNPGFDAEPAWSPDGSMIAFASDRDGNEDIFVMGADGADPINITNDAARDGEPDWQPIVQVTEPTPTEAMSEPVALSMPVTGPDTGTGSAPDAAVPAWLIVAAAASAALAGAAAYGALRMRA